MSNKTLLALDVGTRESGYALVDIKTLKPLKFGKVTNEELLEIVQEEEYDCLAYEEFQSYGNIMGKTVITSITWNGRYIQSALDRNKPVTPVYRKDVKMNLCGMTKVRDTHIRSALIERFGEVGTKANQGYFYGFKSDIWSAYAIAVTYIDRLETDKQE